MHNNPKTRSERLFEELCNGIGVTWNRIPECTQRRPDYELDQVGQRVIAEVKQIDEIGEDRDSPKTLAKRIRKFVNESRRQFESYFEATSRLPTLLVVLNNTDDRRYDDPYTVQTAMFGEEQIELSVPADARQEAAVLDRGFFAKNNSTVGVGRNDQLSAVAILKEYEDLETGERKIALLIFLNHHAKLPLTPGMLHGDNISYYRLRPKSVGKFQDWEPVSDGG